MSANENKKYASPDAKFKKLTTEPVEKLIVSLAVPTIISMLVTSFYNLADTFFVRQLENDSMIAAVGIVLPLMTIIQAFGFFCGHGSGNYISRAFGRKDYKDAETMASTGFFYSVFIGGLIMLLGLVFQHPLVVLLGAHTKATIAASGQYIFYILLATPLMTGSIILNNQLRFQGNAFFAMIGLTSGAIINIILDPLLIFKSGDSLFGGVLTMPFGAGMGISGAALATAISQVFSFTLLLLGLNKSDNIKIHIKNFSFKSYYIKNIIAGGLPSLARQGLASVATSCMNHSIGLFIVGDAAIDSVQAAMTGTFKITNFLVAALIGFGQGFQPVCGFNYGAGLYDRVKKAYKYCVKLSTAFLILLAVIGFICAYPISNAITGSSTEVTTIATYALRAQLITLPLLSLVLLSNMMLQTIGKTGAATIVSMARQGLTFVPCVFLLPILFTYIGYLPLRGIQWAQPAADVLAFIITLPITIKVLNKMR